jgi:hypothetical protein
MIKSTNSPWGHDIGGYPYGADGVELALDVDVALQLEPHRQ